MELGRDIQVRSRMADIEGEGALLEFTRRDLDAGGLAAQRMPTVRTDHEPRRNLRSACDADANSGVLGRDALCLIVEPRQIRQHGGPFLQRPDQVTVLDVEAKSLEPD